MHSFALFSALAGVSLVLAEPLAAPVAAPLITTAPLPAALEGRQTKSEDQAKSEECLSKASVILNEDPMVYVDPLASWMAEEYEKFRAADNWEVDAICSFEFPATIDAPATISSSYRSVLSERASLASKVKPAITSLAQSCGGVLSAEIEGVLATDMDSCTSLYGTYISLVAESQAAETAPSNSESTAGAPRETGYAVAAAAAVVAVAGAVAAL